MKYKGIFSQDDKVISIMSCFGFLEEMKLQVSFHERTSFSQLPFLLLYAIINECMCKLGEVGSKGKRGGSIFASTQIAKLEQQVFDSSLSEKSPQNWSRQSKSFPSTRSLTETFPQFLLFSDTLYLGSFWTKAYHTLKNWDVGLTCSSPFL